VTGTTTQVGYIIIIVIIIINSVQLHPAVLKYSCVTMTRYCNVRIFVVHCVLFVVENGRSPQVYTNGLKYRIQYAADCRAPQLSAH
jgi:hypothetical protein